MRSASPALVVVLLAAGCGSSPRPSAFQVVPGDNVMAVSVDGSRCGSSPYLNEPCVSVKVCVPGTTTCQTVDGILLDTGSFGLRIFRQALQLSLPTASAPGGGDLAECVQFADLTADWGPVAMADVVLANEPAARVPIHVIDATFGSVPPSCPSPEAGPTAFNGILGVGVFVEDCGPTCPASANAYFASSGSTTTPISLDASAQVQNPVARLPRDNNGVIVSLPAAPPEGAPSVDGALVLGVGTRPNNQPTNASAIALDGFGDFTTTIEGGPALGGSFVDTGSNGLFFAAPTPIPTCPDQGEWYCPSETLAFTATNAASSGGGNRVRTPFQIANFDRLTANGNAVYAQVGGSGIPNAGFDWGLPFFLGRTVYLGIAGGSSSFGGGPLLAY